MLRIAATALGPSVKAERLEVNWGKIPVLVETQKRLKVSITSLSGSYRIGQVIVYLCFLFFKDNK